MQGLRDGEKQRATDTQSPSFLTSFADSLLLLSIEDDEFGDEGEDGGSNAKV